MTTRETGFISSSDANFGHTATHIVITEAERRHIHAAIERLQVCLNTDPSDELVRDTVNSLAGTPGADGSEALWPLVKCLPPAIVVRLPEILRAEGASAKTVVLSYLGKDILFRIETAIDYGTAFLALTDLECDTTRQLRMFSKQ